ncbi:hypothetical protein SJZ75_23990 [Klebsiella aerogenes]|uniref:Uncharacterized protein n=1 Tax=Klebsiella aerogenes TaxID=548 RepID=A0AAW9EAY3_KLEAE|nr:hypothetical protein [Klebsiella aerogenes]MDX6778481.1 hypothetical protein [Klebsiella aerogenes]MDX7017567.1 hypothetical protein [Klebsiella aerogenes]
MNDCLGCGHPYPAGHWMYSVSDFIENPFFWAFIIALVVIVILVNGLIKVFKANMYKADRIDSICETIKLTQGGINKRIDENRELLQLIESQCPHLLDKHPWINGWIDSQEQYLLAIAECAYVRVRKSY